jgi:N6-adenosine-specific RNA methylase IME4
MDVSVFVIDPPWPQKKGNKRSVRPRQGKALDYRTMSVYEIFQLLDREVFPLGVENHAVFLWSIDKFLIEGELAMLKRGYTRHARLIWDKTNGIAPAFTVRYSHEYLTWFYRPPMLKIDKDTRGKFRSVFTEKARQHSRKPDIAYEIIQRMYPNPHKRIDVFSRETRDDWQTWGDQVDYFSGR